MESTLDKILQNSNGGENIFIHYIKEYKQHGKLFKSVLRDETQPSANIGFDKSTGNYYYKDFGTGEKALFPVEFIMKYEGCDYKRAIEIASDIAKVPVEKKDLKVQEEILYPDQLVALNKTKLQNGNFYKFCKSLNITVEHLEKWNCGSDNLTTYFVYQNRLNQYLNIKQVYYNENGNRIKEKPIHYLKSKDQNLKYSLCLYGEHLLNYDKSIIVCVVESEKTAIIGSYFYKQFDWVATGGKNIGDAKRLEVLKGRKIFVLPDADPKTKNGKEVLRIPQAAKYFKQNNFDYTIIDLFPELENGYDIADAIRDGLRPEIIKNDKNIVNDSKVHNAYVQVEKWLTERYEFKRNIVSNVIEGKNKTTGDFFEANEHHIHRALQHENVSFSTSKICSLLASDFVPDHDPFLDYFVSLPEWDQSIDYITNLANHVKLKDQEFFNIMFKKMLVRIIACSLDSKYFNKHCFVLVHNKQSSGKTTFLRYLCPNGWEAKYYTENFIPGNKDSEMALSDNFIINLDELASFSKQDINLTKTALSRLNIRQRRPFEKNLTTLPRRASFVGSTNKSEFLTDETGSVRWLCFEIDSISWDYSKNIDINDVWSQAYYLYKNNFKFELTPEELQKSESNNIEFQINTQEMDLINKHFEITEDIDCFKTSTDILNELQFLYPGLKLNSNNIGKALKFFGFSKYSKRDEKYPKKGWLIKQK